MDTHGFIEAMPELDGEVASPDGVSALRRPAPGTTAFRLARTDQRMAGPPWQDVRQSGGTIVYVDARSLTRECIGRFLSQHLEEFEVRLLDPLSIDELDAERGAARAVILNVGGEPASAETTASLAREIAARLPGVPQILLSDHEDPGSVADAFALGVKGYIPTSLAALVAIEVVRLICAGGSFAPASALLLGSRQSAPPSRPEPAGGSPAGPPVHFTQRQLQILDRLHHGLPNKLIAHELAMSENTVKVHIRTIMKKLRATNRTQVVCLTHGDASSGRPLLAMA
jgi:DNA-binding NarL/FixJ family response regulator